MSALDELSDEELRTNALNDPGLFLDMEDDDDDVVLPGALALGSVMVHPTSPHAMFQQSPLQHSAQPPQSDSQPQQQPQPAPPVHVSSNSRLSGVGVPKLDVTALSDLSANAVPHMGGFITPGMTNSPLAYSREGNADHVMAGSMCSPGGPTSSQNSSPHNATTSPNLAAFNVYNSIAGPPLCAKKLSFRDFLNQKAVPQHIENEESTGIFVGQLPSSYSEDDIEALLKAVGNERGQIVQVRDVKCHNRDRTCAFIMINASALSAVLDFTKRVLCDINCVWVVDHTQASQLPIFIQQMPRDQLRGVPKAALVLEKLTPQSKPRHTSHMSQGAMNSSPTAGYAAAMQTTMISPMSMMGHPVFVQQQSAGVGNGVAGGPTYMDMSSLSTGSPFAGAGYMQQSSGSAAMTPFFQASSYPTSPPSGTLFTPGGMAPSPTSVYAMQMNANNNGMASMEAANQMMMAAAAARSRASSQSFQLSMGPPSPSNSGADNSNPLPTAVQLSPALQQEHCSCGRMLFLSQYPKPGTCAKCNSMITPREVAYWCPNGHIAVCVMCSLQTSLVPDPNSGSGARYMPTQNELPLH